MNTIKIKETISRNAAELVRLHKLIHETVKHREEGEKQRRAWEQACEEMHARYSSLAFPGGEQGNVLDRIASGDPFAVEAAICFLELRPYFFRSGYMFKDILRKCKRAPMTRDQSERFAAFLTIYRAWKTDRDLRAKRGAAIHRNLSPLTLRFYALFPVRLSSGRFDGVVTVGDLYIVLCNALKIQPCTLPESVKGVVRQPREQTLPTKDPDYWAKYRAWREFLWTPEDVWATLLATIAEVYNVDPSFIIDSNTVLPKPAEEPN